MSFLMFYYYGVLAAVSEPHVPNCSAKSFFYHIFYVSATTAIVTTFILLLTDLINLFIHSLLYNSLPRNQINRRIFITVAARLWKFVLAIVH